VSNPDANQVGYIYGPVPSRRLGRSLGIDVVPAKICTLDCVYCQIGRTTEKSTVRRPFFDVRAVLDELRSKLAEGVEADYVTIGGSGEPTLNSQIGDLIDGIRQVTGIPVAIITNGTLLHRPDVRAECAKADVVVPSLDAADPEAFEAVNRPASGISIEKLVSGLVQFREEFSGRIWLEVFLIEGLNTTPEQIEGLRRHIDRIRPDRIQLNSAVRPAAEPGIEAIARQRLESIARQIGGNCEIVGAAPPARNDRHVQRTRADVLSMLKRRPCCLEDVCAGIGISRNEAVKHITQLLEEKAITSGRQGGVTYYHSRSE
jgi:wyosine [tRNA(Phe)-imidazoG37] synthetase (radical SAM superfamily)